MILHHTGSKDSYITNKIISGTRRATTGNVGYASTIDLFKLYGESTLKGYKGTCDGVDAESEALCTGTWDPNLSELSRGLIQFDLDSLKTNLEEYMDISHASLKIKLVLKDIQGTQVAPSNFTLQLWSLSKAWNEGIGDDVSSFSNIDATNWLSSSLGTLWTSPGGDWNTSWNAALDVDPADPRTYVASQDFVSGYEDLEMDITDWVRAYWATGNTSVTVNYGWVLKFDSEETEKKSYFVKRFASRHTRNPFLRPKIVACWDSYHSDDRLNFFEGQENKISIRNFVNGDPTAVDAQAPSGVRCRLSWPDLATSTWVRSMEEDSAAVNGTTSGVSSVSIGGKLQIGMYEATITPNYLETSEAALKDDLIASGSLLIQEQWDYIDNSTGSTKILHSGSFYINDSLAVSSGHPRDYRFSILDLKSVYSIEDTPTIRIFVRDRNLADEAVRIPIQLPSVVIPKAYYQIRDTNNQQILIPFSDLLDTPDESTRVSKDSQGMYFSFPVSVLPRGRTYTIDVGYYDRGNRRVYESNMAFRVK